MATVARVVVSAALLAVAAFCAFGFLATYEPPGFPAARAVYGTVGAACVVAAGWALMRKGRAEPAAKADGGRDPGAS